MNTTADLLTTLDLADVAGVSYQTVIRWTHDGVLLAVEGGGIGNPLRFDPAELEVARVLGLWRQVVGSADTLVTIAHAARLQRGENVSSIVAVDTGEGVVITFEAAA